MADGVQKAMEQMLPELEDLQKKGIFSKPEIQAIIEKRRNFEYRVCGRMAAASDFLAHAKYEIALDAVRAKKRKKLDIKKSSISDHAGQRRIHFIFARALRRLHADVSMWKAYLSYAIQAKSNNQLGRIFAKALQLHPNHASLWEMAATWELRGHHNIAAARSNLQRGLRVLKTSARLWHAYFKLELDYLAKLTARRAIMLPDEAEEKATENSLENTESSTLTFNQGLLPFVVYKHACQAVPNNLEFRTKFLAIAASYSEISGALQESILSSLIADFGTDAAMWEACARCSPHPQTIYERAVLALPTAAMWEHYANFLIERVNSEGAEKIFEIFSRAESANCLSPALFSQWASFLLGLGQEEKAVSKVHDGLQKFPGSSALHLLAIHSHTRLCAGNPAKYPEVRGMYAEALRRVPKADSFQIWISLLNFCLVVSADDIDTVVGAALTAWPRSEDLQILVFDISLLRGGLGRSRQMVDRLQQCHLTSRVYLRFLNAEMSAVPVDCVRVRRLFERCVDLFGKSSNELWLEYIRFEREQQDFKKAGDLYWRAVKSLGDSVSFAAAFHKASI
eukprot:gnl/Hemi2/26716_TR8982_c0_g1_i1.p1 gnl/Hemi2/26716_TR8982_c0_g1~~gnl/Hemi2/26716_TR8982_c0_g1_i1.p1  ORF type:complete len:568 (-),score=158.37 gnl/Hemi2/26716_TR8982_c0_g1_i1:47-1750(-)